MNIRSAKTRHTVINGGGFAYDLSDIVRRRRAVILAAFVLTVLSAALVAVFAPQTLAFTAQSGAFVATTGLAMGLIAASIGDAIDARIFGARHVRGTGGELIATIPCDPSANVVIGILQVLDRLRHERTDPHAVLRIGVADASGGSQHAAAWTTALAAAAAARGERVLEVALASDATHSVGVCDVVRDNVPLAAAAQRVSTVTQHARLNAGPNRLQALELLPELTATLPRNLDTYLVSLPLAASRPVVSAVARLDVVLVIAEYARTTRVELIAGLDAIESVGVPTQVLLLHDGATAPKLARSTPETEPSFATYQADTESSMATTAAALRDTVVDHDSTQRIPAPPRVGRVHDDADQALLRATAQYERYANRPLIADQDGAPHR